MSEVATASRKSHSFKIPSGSIKFTDYFAIAPQNGLTTRRGPFGADFLHCKVQVNYCGSVTAEQLPPRELYYDLNSLRSLIGFTEEHIPASPIKLLAAVVGGEKKSHHPFCNKGTPLYFLVKGPDENGAIISHWVKLNFNQGWHLDSGVLTSDTKFAPGSIFFYPTPPH